MASRKEKGPRVPETAAPSVPAPTTESAEQVNRDHLQRTLIQTVIALPLLGKLNKEKAAKTALPEKYEIIIDAHLDFPSGRRAARDWITVTLAKLLGAEAPNDPRLKTAKNKDQPQYVFATAPSSVIRELIVLDSLSNEELAKRGLALKDLPKLSTQPRSPPRAIYQIWEDFKVFPLICNSIGTVKADAGRAAFKAAGEGTVWAIVDSGIDRAHKHFDAHKNLEGIVQAWHRDFTETGDPLADEFGHGTHVAGIVAGEIPPMLNERSHPDIVAFQRILKGDGQESEREITIQRRELDSISGMAPKAQLVSLRVLDAGGSGNVSNIIAALAHVQEINAYGRRIRIHGVNLSVGYPFDAEWFACGQSQLCVEVDRLVRSGVVVVVAAGNTGYGTQATEAQGPRKGGMALTINDPGNADLGITVGSTHRTMPHVYGVSYFSAKGPTGDGRLKPDLLAPGEKVISCAAGTIKSTVMEKLDASDIELDPNYVEYTGTSMAAPHVSGCIAAFLSVKREFIGQPERVKEIFLNTATDLGRERSFQGRGLVDLMRAIQSV